MDGKIELAQSQIYLETDFAFFQVSDFGPGRIVFRASEYRFSDGNGGQYPTQDPAADSIVVMDTEGFLGVIPKDNLYQDYSTSEQDTRTTWVNGDKIYVRTFDLGNIGGFTDAVLTGLAIADVKRIIKYEGFAEGSSGAIRLDYELQDDIDATYYTMPIPFANNAFVTVWYTKN
jgi:hypothetical protein